MVILAFAHTHAHTNTRISKIDTHWEQKRKACPVFVVVRTTKSIQLNDFCKLDITVLEHPMFSPATNYSWCWTTFTITADEAKAHHLMNMGKIILAAMA